MNSVTAFLPTRLLNDFGSKQNLQTEKLRMFSFLYTLIKLKNEASFHENNCSQNKPVRKNAISQAQYGSCSLRIMGEALTQGVRERSW